MSVPKPSGAPAAAKVGYAQAVRDVFIASINKGQFPFAVVGAILLLIIARIPQEEIVPLIKWMVEFMGATYLFGYALFAVTVLGWYFHAQRIRREFTEQLNAFKSGQKTASAKKKGVAK